MAQGASKVKRQEAEKQARELWTKLTMAEQAKKVAEEHLMTGLSLSVSLCVCLSLLVSDWRHWQTCKTRARICGRRQESAQQRR